MKWIYKILVVCILLCSCNNEKMQQKLLEKVGLEGIERISGSMEEGWTVRLKVKNLTTHTATISNGSALVYLNGKQTVKVNLLGEVTVPANQISSVDVPIKVHIVNPLSALILLAKIKDKNWEGLTVDFSVDLSASIFKRTFAYDGVSVGTLMKAVGL